MIFFVWKVSKINRKVAPKPAVPKRDEKPIHGLVSDKNFIVANAVENILAGKLCTWQLLNSNQMLSAFSCFLSAAVTPTYGRHYQPDF